MHMSYNDYYSLMLVCLIVKNKTIVIMRALYILYEENAQHGT